MKSNNLKKKRKIFTAVQITGNYIVGTCTVNKRIFVDI